MLRFEVNDYVQEPAGLLHQLVRHLDEFEDANPDAKSGAWTLAVQSALKRLGEQSERGIEHLCTRTAEGPGTGEFLLDGVWWQRVTPNTVEHLALAVECEFAGWARNRGDVAREVVKDFEKLLVVKSPLKLMIFCSWYSPTDKDLAPMRDGIWKSLKQCITQYSHHIEGEKYLFLDTAKLGERKAWIFTVLRSGSVSMDEVKEEYISF